jgi:hypothetical protein
MKRVAFILSTGHRDRKAALLQVQSLTERDQSDGWELSDLPEQVRTTSFQDGLIMTSPRSLGEQIAPSACR